MEILMGIPFLGMAAFWNTRYGIVPNALIAMFLLAFFPVAWLSEIPLQELTLRGAVFLAALLVFTVLFSWRLIGGGAAKLVAVGALWLPPPMGMLICAICVLLAGLLRSTEGIHDVPWLAFTGRQFATIMGVVGIVLLALGA